MGEQNMNTMYKEVVERRMTPVIVGSFVLITVMINLSNTIEDVKIFDYEIGGITNPILLVFTMSVIGIEFFKCNVKYKYSIIAGELIIYRMNNKDQEMIENIRLENIVYIGRRKECKKKISVLSSKKCLCTLLHFDKACCIYRDGDNYKEVYLDPSERLLLKLKNISKNNQAAA